MKLSREEQETIITFNAKDKSIANKITYEHRKLCLKGAGYKYLMKY